jgi:hypothetical protein
MRQHSRIVTEEISQLRIGIRPASIRTLRSESSIIKATNVTDLDNLGQKVVVFESTVFGFAEPGGSRPARTTPKKISSPPRFGKAFPLGGGRICGGGTDLSLAGVGSFRIELGGLRRSLASIETLLVGLSVVKPKIPNMTRLRADCPLRLPRQTYRHPRWKT